MFLGPLIRREQQKLRRVRGKAPAGITWNTMKIISSEHSGRVRSKFDDSAGLAGPGPQGAVRTLEQMAQRDLSPLTTSELARMIGFSSTFIRKEIRGGYLHAVRIGRGHRIVFRIPAGEALRYVKKLGLL